MWAAISVASPWQRLQVCGDARGIDRRARTSLTGRMPWAPWQLAQVATLSSPRSSALPWPLVRYSASWSTRSEGLKCFMAEASEWHDAAEGGDVLRRRLAAEALLRVVGDVLVLGARVAAVAGGAGEARARVDVVGEELCRRAHAGVVEREVAVDAPDRGDGLRGGRGRRRPGRARRGLRRRGAASATTASRRVTA